MKKLLPIILSIMMILPCNIALAADEFTPEEDFVSKAEAMQFAEELKELDEESYDSSCRLIVSSSKQIDYLDAVDTATGIDDLYVLQFDDEASAKKAEEHYKSLSYVKYVEYDYEEENMLCEAEDDFDFFPQCVSTVNSNIDDAIKLMHKENISMSEIKIGVIDSGIAVTSFTQDRIDGGYSYVEGYKEDGTDDKQGHGTKVAGTIIQNSLDNVRLYSYQILDKNGSGSLSKATSAIYLAITDGCKILNCSFAKENAGMVPQFLVDAIDAATKQGVFVVCGAGNNSKDLKDFQIYPASVESAITVGAMDQNKRLSSFSNFGEGVNIYATGEGMISYDNSGRQVTGWNGTSAATPVISSICALLVMTKPNITVDEVKKLLLETGMSTNENNQNDAHRVIADAYECIKQLTGNELEQLQLEYTVSKNDKTNYSDISFSCDDENATIYYYLGLGGTLEIPYRESMGHLFYKYNNNEVLNLSNRQVIVACAYAPGKAKKVQYFYTPEFIYDSGYLMRSATAAQQYNTISRCQIINEKVIEVPEIVDGYEVQKIDNYCFLGNQTVETIILPESVKEIGYYAFANCPNLKTVIASGVEYCDKYVFYLCDNLVNVEMPNVTVANTGMFKNCTNLETAKLGTLTEIDNHAFYGCKNLKLVKTTADDISFAVNTFKDCNNLTVYTPANSSMKTFANQNDIPLLGEVEAKGGSIRVNDAGLRFGFDYRGEENPNIEEYGFLYSYDGSDDFDINTSGIKKKTATAKLNNGDNISFNLVFVSIPKADYGKEVSARGYIKIGGEYFYSEVKTRSFIQVANAVLADDEIDESTKNSIRDLLSAEV